MNWKTTLALVLVCAGLGSYAYFVEAKKDAPSDAQTQEVILWDVKNDKSVNRVVVEDVLGAKKAEYVKKADAWHYAPRATDSLESFNWDNAYSNLQTLTADRKVDEAPKDLKDYGLDKPTARITVGDATKPDHYQVVIGGKNPIDQSSYYAQVNQDKTVYQIGSWKVDGWLKLASAPPVATPSPAPSPAPVASASKKP